MFKPINEKLYSDVIKEMMEDKEFSSDEQKLQAVKQTKEKLSDMKILGNPGTLAGLGGVAATILSRVAEDEAKTGAGVLLCAGLVGMTGIKILQISADRRERELNSIQKNRIATRYVERDFENQGIVPTEEEMRNALDDFEISTAQWAFTESKKFDYHDYMEYKSSGVSMIGKRDYHDYIEESDSAELDAEPEK